MFNFENVNIRGSPSFIKENTFNTKKGDLNHLIEIKILGVQVENIENPWHAHIDSNFLSVIGFNKSKNIKIVNIYLS